MKSDLCFGKVSGEPLSVYTCYEEALDSAEYASVIYGTNLVPYQCNRCEFWHLSPQSRVTPSVKCSVCKGSDGRPKDTYKSNSEASIRADIIYEEKGLNLKVYRCQKGIGWHLTKYD